MLQIGSLVDGKYKIIDEIAKGGMGVVYLARNERANKNWAIKEVRRDKDNPKIYEILKESLQKETELLKKLEHPRLPSIIDVIEDQDSILIVMDFIEGKNLEKILEEYGAQSQEKVIEWGKQLCEVFIYLHSRKPPIIYRDLKPANVMLKHDGKNIVLIDFGIAREYKEQKKADTTSMATVQYAAPEQLDNRSQTDERTDIYNLGATLYHLVTGQSPVPGKPKVIRQVNPSLSSGFEEIILKCTEENPEDRYQSCAEVMYALEHYNQIDKEYRSKQKKKMNFFIVAAALTVVFAATGVGFKTVAAQQATDNYQELIDEAAKEPSYDNKIKLYEQAIGVSDKAGDTEAYLKLIECFRDNNNEHVFTVDEYAELTKYIKNNKASLMKTPQNYADVCFETGKLIWYYYNYGDNNDNQITRMTTAVDWFADVDSNTDDSYKYKNMARVYQKVGAFYRDISINTVEASDKDIYKPFFDNLNELLESVGNDESESDMVRLELYEICRSALQQYATKFKGEGLSQDELENMYYKIENNVNKMYNALSDDKKNSNVGQGKDVELLKEIKQLLPDTISSIQLAYSMQKGA